MNTALSGRIVASISPMAKLVTINSLSQTDLSKEYAFEVVSEDNQLLISSRVSHIPLIGKIEVLHHAPPANVSHKAQKKSGGEIF